MRKDEISAIEFGKLVQNVESLSQNMAFMRTEINSLLEIKNKGKGIFFGVLMLAGGVGAGMAEAIKQLFRN